MKLHLAPRLLLASTLCSSSLFAAINITSPPVPDPFTAIPPADQWSTLSVGTATDAAITTAAQFDAKIIAAADASLIVNVLGSSGTIQPSTHTTAYQNTGVNTVPAGTTFLQTRPTTNDYLLLLATLSNATGAPLNSVQIAYEYSKATDTSTETIKGLRAFWSVTGTPGSWKLIPALSEDTAGTYAAPQNLSTSILLPAPLAAGGTLYLLYADQNSSGVDASYHIRNFSASPGLTLALNAFATDSVRSPGVSAVDPADDTISFDLTVSGSGALSPSGWTIVSPASLAGTTGAYGTAKSITVPVSAVTGSALQLEIADATAAAATASLAVKIPRILGTNSLTNAPILTAGSPPSGWALDETARTSNQSSSAQGDIVLNSQIIDVSTTGVLQFSADLDAISGGTSGFEAADRFGLQLIIDGGAPINVLGTADTNNDGWLTNDGAAVLELPGVAEIDTTRPFHFTHLIPASANTLQIRIIGNSNSPAETYLVKNVTLGTAPAGLYASLTAPVTVNTRGTADPSDDEFSGSVLVEGIGTGASTGWHSDETPSRTGLYTTTGTVTFGPYPLSGGAKTVTLTDNVNAAFTAALTFTPQLTVYVLGQVNLGGGAVNLLSNAATAVPAEWVNNIGARTLTMNAGTAAESVVTSQTLDLSAVGEVHFSATFHAAETSNGSNFEATDRFKAELIIDGVTHNLISAWDTGDGSGSTVGNGLNGPLNGYLNGYTGVAATDVVTQMVYAAAADDYNANAARDEFNLAVPPQQAADSVDHTFPLSFTIPASANSVQLVITGTGAAGTETFTVSNVQFTTSGGGGNVDTDGDGVTDANEANMGTDPNSALDVLRLSVNPAVAGQVQFPSKSGRFYRVYSSTNLQTWTDAGQGTISGDGSTKQFTASTTGGPRRFYRLLVMGTDGPWPASF